MKNKLFFLCLLAALSFPFTAHSQNGDWSDEYNSTYTVEDSLNLSKEYYADLQHWDIFIEPGTIVGEDSVFDMAGLRHAYYTQRYYIYAIPKGANFRFMPSPLSQLFFYGQRLPVEGKELQYFQRVREVVFPYAAQFSATTPSRTIFEQYVQQRLDADVHYILDSLITERIRILYDFNDTNLNIPWQRELNSTITRLESEYHNAISPTPSPSLSVVKLANHAIKHAPNVYLVPQNSLLKLIADESRGRSVIDELFPYDYDLPSEYSVRTYTLLDNRTIVSFNNIGYYKDCEINYDEYTDYNVKDCYIAEHGIDSDDDIIVILSSNGYEKKSLADYYKASLKDTIHCRFLPEYPPHLRVYVDDEVGSHRKFLIIGEENKDIILKYLKEGSPLYNHFAKDFYKDFQKYVNVNHYDYDYSIATIELVSEKEESTSPTTLYLSKQQSQKIQKLLKKKNQLEYQRTMLSAKQSAKQRKMRDNARIPHGQLRVQSYFNGWKKLYGENDKIEASNVDSPVVEEPVPEDPAGIADSYENVYDDNVDTTSLEDIEKSKYAKLTAKINKIKETINTVAGCKLYNWLWDGVY